MPSDLNFMLIFGQNDVFHHFLIFAPFFTSFFCYLLRTLLCSYIDVRKVDCELRCVANTVTDLSNDVSVLKTSVTIWK